MYIHLWQFISLSLFHEIDVDRIEIFILTDHSVDVRLRHDIR